MTNDRAPRQARVTDQDLRALISKIDRVLAILEAEPPRAPQTITAGEQFYPGVGTVRPTHSKPPGPSPIQLAAAAALDARDT